MYKNYYYLNRLIVELNDFLKSTTIKEVFTQEKDNLYFSIPSEEYPNRHLIINTNPLFSYLTIKNELFKAKKNVVYFFENYFPAKIDYFEIAISDRIIKINLYNGVLFFVIRGGKTNVIFSNNYNIEYFKNSKDDKNIINELDKLSYTNNYSKPNLDVINDINSYKSQLKQYYPQISKEFYNNNTVESIDIIKESILNRINEIYYSPIESSFNDENTEYYFRPNKTNRDAETDSFNNYIDAINNYIILKHKNDSLINSKNVVKNYLEKKITYYSSKIYNLQKRVDEGCKEIQYRMFADLLLSNINNMTKGEVKINCLDYITNEEIEIKIDPKLTPNDNVKKYYDKARDERINFSKSIELLEEAKIQLDFYLNEKEKFELIENVKNLVPLMNKYKISSKESKRMESPKFKHYIIDGKYKVYVGKDSKSNDDLSIKFAKQNDYWFHVRGLPGSHVVLKVENTKEIIPKNIIKDVASLAAYHSKAKTASTVPVIYTFAKYVTKKKGMDPGQVSVMKENVVIVKPEIPKSAEFIEE